MANKIIQNIKSQPPLTTVMIASAILLLQGSKSILIESLPIGNEELKTALGGWFTYILEAVGVLVGLYNIFKGTPANKSPYQDVADKINTNQ